MSASFNDLHILDYAIQTKETKSIDLQNEEVLIYIYIYFTMLIKLLIQGWTPAHLAAFLGNFDSLNLLIENGADLCKYHNSKMNCFDEIIRNDN